MTNESQCVVCGKALQSGDVLAGSGKDLIHAACDRRRADRLRTPPTCVVCNRLIDSSQGSARLDGRLVHGACYVQARSARAAGSVSRAREPTEGLFRRLARRWIGR